MPGTVPSVFSTSHPLLVPTTMGGELYRGPIWQMRTRRCSEVKELPWKPAGQLSSEELQLDPRFPWLCTFAFQQPHLCGSPSTRRSLHNGRAGVFISTRHLHHSEHPTHHHWGARWANRPKSTTTFEIVTRKCSIDNPNRSHHFPSGNSPSHHTWDPYREGHTRSAPAYLPPS